MSLTEEKALRTEAREAAEEKERQERDAERKKAYDEVRFPSSCFTVPPINLYHIQDPLKDYYGDRPFTNQKSGAIHSWISRRKLRANRH